MFHIQVSQKKSSWGSYSPVSAPSSLERGQGQLGSRVDLSVGVCVTATAVYSTRQAADDAEGCSYDTTLGSTCMSIWQCQDGWLVMMCSYSTRQAADDAVGLMTHLLAVHDSGNLSDVLACVRALPDKQQVMLEVCWLSRHIMGNAWLCQHMLLVELFNNMRSASVYQASNRGCWKPVVATQAMTVTRTHALAFMHASQALRVFNGHTAAQHSWQRHPRDLHEAGCAGYVTWLQLALAICLSHAWSILSQRLCSSRANTSQPDSVGPVCEMDTAKPCNAKPCHVPSAKTSTRLPSRAVSPRVITKFMKALRCVDSGSCAKFHLCVH